jgi:subtilisin family serine protease
MIFLLLISTFLIPTPQDAQSSPISIFSFQTDPSPVLVGQNFTYSIKVKNLDNKPIYVIPISRESFDPPDSVNIVKDYRPLIFVLPEKLDPGEVATVGPLAEFSGRRAGEIRITVYVSWSYSEEYSVENPWYEISETFSFMIYESQQETYKIYFSTEPPDVGSITFSGTTYTSGQSGKYAAGIYHIEANVPEGYVFDGWLFYGTQYGGQPPPIEFEDPGSPSTKVIIRGEGTIAAIFKWIVKLRGTVAQYSMNEYEIYVRIDELLLDTSGRLRLGEEIWVHNPASNWQPGWVKEGDRVEIYGLGFCMGDPLCQRHGIVIKWPMHYVRRIEASGVKFRGVVWTEPNTPYDIEVMIDEVLLDPEGRLSSGSLAHVDIAVDPSKCECDWPLHIGDRVEVYARHYWYGYANFTVGIWIYSRDHPYDGYVKKIGVESIVLLIGGVISHDINKENTTIRVEKLLSCAKLGRIYPKAGDYEINFVEVNNRKCDWEREIEGKEVIVKWDEVYNGQYKISSIPPGTTVEFLGKLLKTGNPIYGQLKVTDDISYFIIPGIYSIAYIKSFTVNHDFDSWDENHAANVYFKVNVKGVDDDADGSIDEDGEYVRLPTNEDPFMRKLKGWAWEILVRDNELGREIVGPKISDAGSNIRYFPVPISIDIEVMDEDPEQDDLMARFSLHISKEELQRNDYRLCLAKSSDDDNVRIELCLEPLLPHETGLLHNSNYGKFPTFNPDLKDSLDLELNFKDISGFEAFSKFNNKRFEEVSVAVIEWDYPDISLDWPTEKVEVWECSIWGCERVKEPPVCKVRGERDSSHASMTSGIVISKIDGIGPAGLGWNTRLLIIKAEAGLFRLFEAKVVGKAIKLAVDKGAKAISLSIGTVQEDSELVKAITYAINNNVVIVSAAGNYFTSRSHVLNRFKSIIKVAGVTRLVSEPISLEGWWTGAFFSSAPYSNYGKFPTFNLDMELRIDFSSLSTIFKTTNLGCQYQLGTGTSSAAPTLASIVALIQGYAKAKYGRYLTINEVYEILRQASIDLGERGWDPYYGWGLVDVEKALEVVEKGIPAPIYNITELPKPKSGTLIRMSSNGSQLFLHVVDDRGRILFGFSKNFAEIIAEKSVEHTVTENFTEVFLPLTSGTFKILIDAGYSHQGVERVNLTIMIIKDDLVLGESRVSSLIERGGILSYNMRLDVEGGINVKEGINGDVNMDGVVDYKDLAILAASYGKMENELGFNANADFNRDGIIDYKDLAILAANYGGRSS